MKFTIPALLSLSLALAAAAAPLAAQPVLGPVTGDQFRTQYVRLSNNAEGLLYEPAAPGAKARFALIQTHTNRNSFNEPAGREMASRGYRVLMLNFRGDSDILEDYLPSISQGMAFLRTVAGVQKVILVGHSGGGHLTAFYANVAANGPAACNGPEKIYPCRNPNLANLQKPDGYVMLDPTTGAFHQMSAVDPAFDGEGRNAGVDMFAAANGYDAAARKAAYPADFAKRFYAAQHARNKEIVDAAVERLKLLAAGKGLFTDDEPLLIRGMGVNANGARLYQPDLALQARTKKPHTLLKADGTDVQTVIATVRPPSGQESAAGLRAMAVMNQHTTVRKFLANSAIRTTPDYAVTETDIVGVDWASNYTSTANNVTGITVPTVIVTMGCHYLLVPGEIFFDNLAATDKTYATVEGAAHVFTPCQPQYGNTVKRLFDFVDAWVSKPGRF